MTIKCNKNYDILVEELRVSDFIKQKEAENRFAFKKFSDDDTHALRDLKTAAEKKLLWQYIVALGIPDNTESKNSVYYYYNGKYKSIANPHIFLCREKMQPSKWYYRIDEQLPERIDFIPKYGVEYLQHKESIGHIKLEELQKRYTMPGLCNRYDLSLQQMKNVRYRRLNPLTGKECFKILPPASVIIKLRDVINPDYWYVFPEELY